VSPASVFEWMEDQASPPLVYTSADPAIVREAQEAFGRERVADSIETFFGTLASILADNGYQRIVSAGGETSGAIVSALNIKSMEIGPEIAAGVPALRDGDRELVLALKSGNFGGETFFADALEVLAT
ncbi:MAG: nucleotide-binding domain containing protein, partial [Pseudomonadota bacterium]